MTDDLREVLADGSAVHVNMLRGSIAKPTAAQIWHIYGAELLSEMRLEHLPAALRQVEQRAYERAAEVAENPGFIEARDTEWDIGVNDAKRLIATAIRALASPAGG